MLKTSMLILALTMSLAGTTTTFAAPKRTPAMDSYNSTVVPQSDQDRLFDRAKGNID